MKKVLSLLAISLIFAGCVTTTDSTNTDEAIFSTDEYSVRSFEENSQGYRLTFLSVEDSVPDGAIIHIMVGNSGDGRPYKKGVMEYQFGSLGIPESGMFDIEFGIGIPHGNQLSVRSKAFFKNITKEDIQNNFRKSSQIVIEESSQMGVEKSSQGNNGATRYAWVKFTRPDITYDLSMNPAPPVGFEKRDGEAGIGIIDFKYNKPIYIYQDTTLDQIATLLPEARRDGRIFHLKDGGLVIIEFSNDGKTSQFYPRHTNRFTLISFPQLPWDYDVVATIFGERFAMELSEGEGQIQPFSVQRQKDMNGLRLDYKDNVIDGFRIWHPDFIPGNK